MWKLRLRWGGVWAEVEDVVGVWGVGFEADGGDGVMHRSRLAVSGKTYGLWLY